LLVQVSRLRAHLDQIKRDDRLIKKEGIDVLSEEELRQACRARGMRAPFGEGAAAFMRKQLAEWLDLSLNRRAAARIACLCIPEPVKQDVLLSLYPWGR
jgi:LETM1 and EF-hand domain-containing protein 1